jgi:hypothetical protein
MSLVLQSSGGGQITIQEPATASNFTQTLPAATGTVQVSGNQPAFSAYQSSSQSLTNASATKIQFQTELFDTANAFDSTTNYRFQPQVAGYYQIGASFAYASAVNSETWVGLYKNGSIYQYGNDISATVYIIQGNWLVYLNGSTDYVEIYAAQYSGSSKNSQNAATQVYFSGVMVRSA